MSSRRWRLGEMNAIEWAAPERERYRWRKAGRMIALSVLAGCALVRTPTPVDSPSEAARHKAALATIVVENGTSSELTIAFHSATPPVQQIVIGSVLPGAQARMAPVPAGEPII